MNAQHHFTKLFLKLILSLFPLIWGAYYVFAYIALPVTGITLYMGKTGWMVTDVSPCISDDVAQWCEQRKVNVVKPGDIILSIGSEPFVNDRRYPAFVDYRPLEVVPLQILRGHERIFVTWQIPPVDQNAVLSRLFLLLFPFSFWAAGTIVFWFVPERNEQWWLFVAFCWLFAVWESAGAVSSSLVAYSSLVIHAAIWPMAVLTTHLHEVVIRPFPARVSRRFWVVAYILASVMAILELAQVLPIEFFWFGGLLLLIGTAVLFLWRAGRVGLNENSRLIAIGWTAGFLPGGLWLVLSMVTEPPLHYTWFATATFVLMPHVYVYSLYRRVFRRAEVQIREVVAATIFVLFTLNIMAVGLLVIRSFFNLPESWLSQIIWPISFGTIAGVGIFCLAKNKLLTLIFGSFERRLEQTQEYLLERINTSPSLPELGQYICHQLALDQMAIYTRGETAELAFQHGTQLTWSQQGDTPEWVQVNLLLNGHTGTVGQLLVGTRDNGDGFYSDPHLSSLRKIANQLAVVIELEQQKEALQRQVELMAQQEKMAALGRLAASLAHEINNPLFVIKASLETMAQYDVASNDDHYFKMAYESAAYAADVVRNVTFFARPQTGPPTYTDVNESVSQAIGMFGSRLKEEQISLSLHTDSHLPLVLIRQSELTQVVANLVDNACDAMRGCNKKRLVVQTSNGDGVTISVSDTGVGIPQPILPKLFEPFFTTKKDGSGFGLSISYSIIERSGGRVTAESVDGQGATFTVWLPPPSQGQEV